jgi:hypothetical protein
VEVGKSMTIGESTSGKSLDCRASKLLALGVVLGTGTEVGRGNTYEQGRVGEERGGKEMDRCPLTEVGHCWGWDSCGL